MFYIKHVSLILLGCFLGFFIFGTITGLFDPNTPLSDRLLVSSIFLFLMLLSFSPLFELIRSKLTGSKQSLWSEITDMLGKRVALESVRLANESPAYRRKARITAILKITVFCVFIVGAHPFTKNNIYEYSNNVNIFLWAVMFPSFYVLYMWQMLKAKYEKHVKLLGVLGIVLAAFLVTPLMFYFDIVVNENEGVTSYKDVTIKRVNLSSCTDNKTCLCEYKITLLDEKYKSHNVCLAPVGFGMLHDGDTPYIDDGEATVGLVTNKFGSYVKSIKWHQKYNSTDRKWSVKEQKYHYLK